MKHTMRTHLRRLFACIALAIPPVYAAETDVTARFDASVSNGLPVTLSVHHRAAHADDGDERAGSLTVDRRLPVEAVFPDGTTHVVYAGTLDGKEVVLTGSDDHIDIGDGERASRGLSAIDSPSKVRVRKSVDPTPVEGVRTLDVHFFLHDNLRERHTADDIHADYVAWWLKDMTDNVLPSMRIVVHYHQSEVEKAVTSHYYTAPHDITNLDMRNANALELIAQRGSAWVRLVEQASETHMEKFVLLTGPVLPSGAYGLAYQGGSAAIASLDGSYRVVAHEAGHLLGAEHADSAILYWGGWWCESNMYPYAFGLRSKCYAYTKENERRVRNYVIAGADVPFHERVVIEG